MSLNSGLIVRVARVWVVIAAAVYAYDMLRTGGSSLTDPNGRPLGDDFLNYWSGAFLAWHGRAAEVYDWPAYHAFQQSIVGAGVDSYFYGYPPILLVLTAPLAALPYLTGLGVWLTSSWLCFYRALAMALPGRSALLLAAATPAVFVNAYGGQNGVWTAALFGGALCLIDRRPFIAGLLFGAMTYKPQLGVLIPVALLAGRRWQTITGAAITAGGLILASVLLFGPDMWRDFGHVVSIQRQVVLEDGTQSWHRMVSVFALARRLGADAQLAYAAQIIAALTAAALVALAWFRDAPSPIRNASLVLGTLLATPYLMDYDTVVCAFVAVWLMSAESLVRTPERQVMTAVPLLLLLPLLNPILAQLTGVPTGALMIAPAFLLTARMILAAPALPAPATQ